jgi:hypothetical protein
MVRGFAKIASTINARYAVIVEISYGKTIRTTILMTIPTVTIVGKSMARATTFVHTTAIQIDASGMPITRNTTSY